MTPFYILRKTLDFCNKERKEGVQNDTSKIIMFFLLKIN